MKILFSGTHEPLCQRWMATCQGDLSLVYLPIEEWLQHTEAEDESLLVWLYVAPWRLPAEENSDLSSQLAAWLQVQRTVLRQRQRLGSRLLLVNLDQISATELLARLGTAVKHVEKTAPVGPDGWTPDQSLLAMCLQWAGPCYWDVFEALESAAYLPTGGQPLFRHQLSHAEVPLLQQFLQRWQQADQLAGAQQQLQSALQTQQALQDNVAERFSELAQLTQMLEEQESQHAQLDKEKAKQANSLRLERDELKQQLAQLQSTQETKQKQLALAKQDAKLAETKATELTQALSQTKQALTKTQTELDEGKQQQAQLEQQQAELQQQIDQQQLADQKQRSELSQLHEQLEQTRQSLDERFRELATMTHLLEASTRELQDKEQQLATAQQRNAQLKRTLSWKATAPIRVLATKFKGKKDKSKAKLQADIQLIEQSGLFNSDWYLKQYPDVAKDGMDPIRHYIKFGALEGRDPSERFSSLDYLERYPDVSEAGLNPLVHYLRFGQKELRIATTKRV